MDQVKICGVCGDKALGFNFNALTCESCKAFFRRNALRNKNFRCMTAGNCVLNPKTRKYCRRCRLNKCFQIGMKKEWILTEEEKVLKRRKHRIHHRTRDSIESSSSNSGTPDADSSSFMNPMLSSSSSSPSSHNENKNLSGTSKLDSRNNIIILPVLPLSIDGSKDPNEIIQSLNKNEIINYINQKLEMNLPTASAETTNSGTTSIIICTENFQRPQQHQPNGSDDKLSTSQPRTSQQYFDNEASMAFSVLDGHQQGNVWSPACCNENNNLSNASRDSTTLINNNENMRIDYNSNTNSWCHRETKQDHHQSNDKINYDWKISDNIYKHAIQLEYTSNPLNMGSDDSGRRHPAIAGRKLNELEDGRLREVNEHFNSLGYWTNMPSENNNKKFIKDIEDSLKYFEFEIKRVIIAVKNIRSFKIMCQEDQIILLKGSATEIKILQNIRFMARAISNELFEVPDPKDQDSILVYDTELLRKAYGDELMCRCRKLVMSFRQDWQEDSSIINLLAMILLFYPNRNNLLHPEYVTLEYFTYCHLLQRYLEVKYETVCEAKTIYLNLISRLEEIHELNDQCMELILKMDPKYIGPLTIELLEKKIPTSQQR